MSFFFFFWLLVLLLFNNLNFCFDMEFVRLLFVSTIYSPKLTSFSMSVDLVVMDAKYNLQISYEGMKRVVCVREWFLWVFVNEVAILLGHVMMWEDWWDKYRCDVIFECKRSDFLRSLKMIKGQFVAGYDISVASFWRYFTWTYFPFSLSLPLVCKVD